MKPETLDFLIGILFSAIITYFLTFIPIWQLIIIPGLVAGFFNKKTKKGMYSGAIGISSIWLFYMSYLIIINNAYTTLDQIARFYFGIWNAILTRIIISPIGFIIFYFTGIKSLNIQFLLIVIFILLLIIIPSLAMGLYNKKMRKHIYNITIAISSIWLVLMFIFYLTTFYTILGYGWLFFIFIILSGILFGMLGGAIGSYLAILIKFQYFVDSKNNIEINNSVDINYIDK